jgi:hypothetical protein
VERKELIKESRLNARQTQEEAAQNSQFDLRTIQAFEYGERKVPDDAVILFAKAYNDKQLIFKCLVENPMYKAVLPPLNFTDLDLRRATLGIVKKISIVKNHIEDLCEIAADNKIDQIEWPQWHPKQRDIMALIAALMELIAADGCLD